MPYATLDELRSQLGAPKGTPVDPAYVAKMLHEVPQSTSVDRAVFLLQQVAGKRVLEFGASGPMHDGIVKAAAIVKGYDLHPGPGVERFDLDVIDDFLPLYPEAEVIVCGEILEHLSNPGYFLQRLQMQYAGVPVVITVPNAFCTVALNHMRTGTENVNIDHVCWYSYRTLKTLLERYGYTIRTFHWYDGPPYVAEGLIVVTESR